MLIIVCGTTLEVGETTRSLFSSEGFEIIKKKIYRTENASITPRTDSANILNVTEDEINACDFKYETGGVITGFDKSQIIDACLGKKNCLLSVTPDTFEFVEQVKATFGDYVVVVYAYIDETALRSITVKKDGITEEEINSRLETGRRLRLFCAENMKFFDETVIFSGEGTAFDHNSLRKQYMDIISKALKKQELLNNKSYVELPYKGSKDYIFISYSHKDTKKVLPVLYALQRSCYRVWYDEGIRKGENWRVFVGEKLKNCKNFLIFISENATKSDNVVVELGAALDCKKKIIKVVMDDSSFEFGIQMYIRDNQHCDISSEKLIDELCESLDKSTAEIVFGDDNIR